MYMSKAETEMKPEKKALFFQMAKKLLQASASSYKKANHPEKSEEVERILKSVEEGRQLALSLTKVLHAPTITPATAFSTQALTRERAVGLEKFEHANVEGKLTVTEGITIGEELEIQLDLVNVAKNFGLLIRLDKMVPLGFTVTAFQAQYSMESGSINMKGKRLEPFKVESIKLRLQATEAGVVNLSPQVIYVDDVGKFKVCKPEPVSVTIHPKLTFRFKTKAAENIFNFLTKSFVQDYMRKKISLEMSGWRTLMQIVRHGNVPKSQVYGSRRHRGHAISELETRGLIEMRVFLGERGRGGKIAKARISYKKETIKRYVDKHVMKNGEK
jgi:hypothetical protein